MTFPLIALTGGCPIIDTRYPRIASLTSLMSDLEEIAYDHRRVFGEEMAASA
jgi:hypothetical protein